MLKTVVKKKYKMVLVLVIILGLLFSSFIKSPDILFMLKKYELSNKCAKLIYRLDGKKYKITGRSMKYHALEMYKESFDLIDFVYTESEKKRTLHVSDVLLFLEYGIYAGEYEKVTEVLELYKEHEKETGEESIVLTNTIGDLAYVCKEYPDIDERFKSYAIDLIEFEIEFSKNDESKKAYLEHLNEIKKELESMLQ